jgi:hypothetical protein
MLGAISLDLPSEFLDDPGSRAGFVLLGSFLITFLFIRTSARLIRSPKVPWWPGSVTTDSGLHLHHLVWGIVLLLLSGMIEFATGPDSPWNEILAAAFGIGAGLTLDEFALWVYLRDVYWTQEGRASLDAVVVATAIGGLVVLGVAPFDLNNNSSSVATLCVTVSIIVVLTSLAILKGKPLLGMIGIFIPVVSLVGAVRLASPSSPWARRFYAGRERKLERSRERFARVQRRRRWLGNAVGGAPSAPSKATGDGGAHAGGD